MAIIVYNRILATIYYIEELLLITLPIVQSLLVRLVPSQQTTI